MVHGEHGAKEADARQRAADNEYWLERMSGNVADERDIWVRLPWVARAADREPSQQQDSERQKPEEPGRKREEPETANREEVLEGSVPNTRHFRYYQVSLNCEDAFQIGCLTCCEGN